MFLSRRTMQAEYFDSERPPQEVAQFYRSLGRVNQFFDFAEPFRKLLPLLLHETECRSLAILDVGAGDGSLGRTMERWAAGRGWKWRVTNLDCSLAALNLNAGAKNVAGSASRLPFRPGSFDIVIASQMAHHLTDIEVKLLLQETWKVARRAVVLCDLHRNIGLYLLLMVLFCFQKHPASFRADGLLSVKRGWRVEELLTLARQAGIPEAKATLRFGTRVVLHVEKVLPKANEGISRSSGPAMLRLSKPA
jgi:2-polyprenyl-3-methyl-5-hydroxy-6-metoxy-1,4-benzoquinol methylase